VPFENHFDREFTHQIRRLDQMIDCGVRLTLPPIRRPPSSRIAVEREFGSMLATTDRQLRIIMRGIFKFQLSLGIRGTELTQEKIPFGTFVVRAARTIQRQAFMGQSLQANGGHPRLLDAEFQIVGVALGLITTRQYRIIRKNG
jgi:hypothetical protein